MPAKAKEYNSAEVRAKADISIAQLNLWVLKGVVNPKIVAHGFQPRKIFSQEDLEKLARVKKYLDQGFTLTSAIQKVQLE